MRDSCVICKMIIEIYITTMLVNDSDNDRLAIDLVCTEVQFKELELLSPMHVK